MKTDELLDKMTNAFLSWKLPDSVCSDRCATMQGPGRIGTNLLTFVEAKQMFKDVVMPELKAMMQEDGPEMGYGFFCGGDPRKFYPDAESCSEKEIENHTRACALWNEAEARGEKPTPEACPSGWIRDDKGNALAHVLRTSYGIGTYEIETAD